MLIGVLDTGIKYDHEDLMANLQYNYADPVNGVDDDNDGYIDNYRGWDFSNNDNDATTPTNNGHGVPVTGVVSATTNNGMGIAGVGFKCHYLPLKVYPSGVTTGRFMGYEGIVYAADHNCDIINLSWGSDVPASAFEQEVINYAAINHDAVVVAAAGNTDAQIDFFPASYDNVLSVGSTDSLGVKGYFNTYSFNIDLVAPGMDIWTTVRNVNKYGIVSGSSFACPQAAGCAALVRSKWPQLTAQQVAEQVRVTADPSILSLPANQPYRDQLGRGMLECLCCAGNSPGHFGA